MSAEPASLDASSYPPPQPMSVVQWLICIIAAIGFAFDIYVLLMLPLIIKPVMLALGGYVPGTAEYTHWARLLFFLPAIVGGIFGLLGGYLTDLLGRRRILTASIVLYAVCTFLSGYATSLPQLLALRCGVFVGVCVEFVAAVAWLAELFPNPKQRETVLGYTQAFSSFGGLMIAGMNFLVASTATKLPAIHGLHEGWRYTLMSGLIPAIPLILIRPFLPESPAWQQKKAAGTLRRPSILAIFSPALLRTTIVTTVVFASSYGLAFGAIQQLPQILGAPVGGHKQIAE
ncbi:MAG TPA: MFS transporter, partial [Tepidisphaeraceae bacterium]